jgi:hypothetical protein
MSGNSRFKEAKEKSIVSYLEGVGVKTQKQGHKYWCSSPFSSDSVWSFAVYPNNTFYDWANNVGGDIIDLVAMREHVGKGEAVDIILGNKISEYVPVEIEPKKAKPFNIRNYLLRGDTAEVDAYAKERCIDDYTAGKWMLNINNEWIDVPSLLFRQYDENGHLIGARFRTVESAKKRIEKLHGVKLPKFNSRGRVGWHILRNRVEDSFKEASLYIMESETSATSLLQYCKEKEIPVVILCFGGVNNKLLPIPYRYKNLDKYLIIDFDGDEEKFEERLENISLKDAEPLKLILDKGEDINSLYCNNQMYKISNLIR